jgi:uncharacterized protein YjhX (UPF0386 family)
MAQRENNNAFIFFINCLEKNGFKYRSSTAKEKTEDIDLVIWKPDNPKNAFALAIKKTIIKTSKRRKHVYGWVEAKDKYGKDGWLYKKCTFIVYERKNDFVLIQKDDFRNWIQANNIARWDLPFVKDSWSAHNRLYRRNKTREAIFHVRISDALKKCRHHVWKKVDTQESE